VSDEAQIYFQLKCNKDSPSMGLNLFVI